MTETKPRKHYVTKEVNLRNTHKRRKQLDQAAQRLGFETWNMLETAVKNGKVILQVLRNLQTDHDIV